MNEHINTKLRKLYMHYTQEDLANILGISLTDVKKITKKLNIKRRIQKERPIFKNKEDLLEVISEKELEQIKKSLKELEK